jgi:phosphoglycolate phosphatase
MSERALSDATIAFDLDGTLVDTAPDLIGTLNALLSEEGLSPLPLAQSRAFIGQGARRLIERGFQAAGRVLHPVHSDRLLERFLVRYRAHIADQSRPFPGCEATLAALRAEGARLVVCTNKPTDLSLALLKALDLLHRVDAVVGPDLAPAPKPDPRHLLAAIEAVGGRASRAIMVGDAAPDVGAARSAGAGLVLVSFGYTEVPARDLDHDVLIDSFDELPAACERLLAACGRQTERL